MVASLVNDNLLQFLLGEVSDKGMLKADEMFRRVLAFLLSQGYSAEQLADIFGDLSVKELALTPEVTTCLLKLQTTFAIPLQDRIAQISHVAFERKLQIALYSENDNVADRAVSDLLDRSLGKAVQRVDVKSTNLDVTANLSEIDAKIQSGLKKLEELNRIQKSIDVTDNQGK